MGGTSLDLYNEQKQLAEIRSSIAHYLSTWGSQEAQVVTAWADVLSPRPHVAPAAPAAVARTPSLAKQTESKTRAAKAAEEKSKKPLLLEIDPLTKASVEQKHALPRASPMLSPPVRSLHQSPQVPKARPPNGSPSYHRRSSLQGAEMVSDKSPVSDGLPRMASAAAKAAHKRPESSPPQVLSSAQAKSPSPHLSRSTSSESMERFLETCHDEEDEEQEAARDKKNLESLSSTANELLLESRELSGSMKSGSLFVMRRRRLSSASSKPMVTPTHSTGSTSASRGRPPVAPQTPTASALAQGYTSPGAAALPVRMSGGPPPRAPKEDVETPKRTTPSHSEERTPPPAEKDCTGIFLNTPYETPDGKLLQRSSTATPKHSVQKEPPLPGVGRDMDSSSCSSSSSAGSYV